VTCEFIGRSQKLPTSVQAASEQG